ncbi:nucleotidyl transferase AbiEii/AbiGii toxin family protein [Dyadobacter sp. CY107]|uniref:nucleotidyl transferase AbiEii/AbiGii toxin family protein n=1 Tax=Dyadobacter fanqingshengii TaxID=2906443 RepID=UPI001F46E870|nr:nucleotidyl transferase AbiEii/AbiGii toxin family protein [Dyadobacter fanqingshengii]MCF2506940.1 nucleotidyl transferase AbiEii/AbiGii toxin family protein [Dyadobacter fanqingshengii]
MSHQQNIIRLKVVYNALEELANEFVFIGGATVSLYADRVAEELRPTDDVDILAEIFNYADYARIEEKLRSKGFVNDVESGVICRFKARGIIIDVMPTDDKVLGFSNKWYPAGYSTAISYVLDEKHIIKIFNPAYFIASKLEAFKNRGNNDGRTSSDFEDIVYILNNRSSIWNEFNNASANVKSYLKTEFSVLLENKYFDEWISANLEISEQKRARFIIGNLRELVG